MYALAKQRIFCFEKMVLKLGFLLVAIAVFSGQNMSMSAYNVNFILKGHVIKEHTNALFLLQQYKDEEMLDKYSGYVVNKVDDGIYYIRQNKLINNRNIKINVVEIDRKLNPNIEIIPKLASKKLHSKSKIENIEKDAIIAVNGTYFKQDTGTPLGALVIDNQIITGPIYERVALGIGKNEFKTARISFNGTLKNKYREIKIDNINQPRMSYSQTLIYTSKWGEKPPEVKGNMKHIVVVDERIIATSTRALFIPKDGVVISAPASNLEGFEVGDKVAVEYSLIPKWKNINNVISGGPYLMKDGNIFIDVASQKLNAITGRNPRTAVGYTKDNAMILVTVDGRKEGSSGVTLEELAKIMSDLGCYEAINLDGGSSTVMYVNGHTFSGSNIKSVMLSNALVVKNRV